MLSPTCPDRLAPPRAPRRLTGNARLDSGLVIRGGDSRGGAQRVHSIGALPREVVVLAAEVAVRGGLLEDRAVQVEVATEGRGSEVEDLPDRPDDVAV